MQAISARTRLEHSNSTHLEVLFVDLDGSLIATDLLLESLLRMAKSNPRALLQVPGWLRQGKATLKSRLAEIVTLDVTTLPYRPEVLALLRSAKASGCHLVLATASNQGVAERVADHLQLFDAVLGSDDNCNLKGETKLEAIKQYCRDHHFSKFSYLGDSTADLPIWEQSEKIIAIAPPVRLRNRLLRIDRPINTVVQRSVPWKVFLKAMRPHQWSKNVLIFVPTLLAHDFSPFRLLLAAIAFMAFSMCASAVYLLNDLLDLETDRRHPTKFKRPFASGKLPLQMGLYGVPLLISLGFGIAFTTGALGFPLILAAYLAASLLYCLWFKRKALVDVFLLSALYMLRIQAGGIATGVPVSEWLLAFSLFFFLSLAFAKRFVELDRLTLAADQQDTGRGYQAVDVAAILSMGPTSGYIAALVLALYINSSQVTLIYSQPKILWLLCPLVLFWISRLWLLARRNELHDDPVVFALKDHTSQLLGFGTFAIVTAAWLFGS